MKLKDLLTFVKAGYKPGEVKELLEMVKDEVPEEPEEPAETSQKDEQQPEPEKAKEPSSDTGSDDQIQQLQQKIRDLETKLAAAQSQNAEKDLSGDEPDESAQLNDLIRSYM